MKIIEESARVTALRELSLGPDDPPQPYEPFMYRGRVYVRGPVPRLVYRGQILPILAGMRRLQDEVQLDGASKKRVRELRRLIRRVYPLVKRFARPAVPGIRKRLWRLLPNPFQSEAAQLLGILMRGAHVTLEAPR